MVSLYSITDLKKNAAQIITNIEDGSFVVILRNSRPVAAVIPYTENLEDILEEIGWQTNEELKQSILKAKKEKGGISSAALRKKLMLKK